MINIRELTAERQSEEQNQIHQTVLESRRLEVSERQIERQTGRPFKHNLFVYSTLLMQQS